MKCACLRQGAIGLSILSIALSIREENGSTTESLDLLSQAGMFQRGSGIIWGYRIRSNQGQVVSCETRIMTNGPKQHIL